MVTFSVPKPSSDDIIQTDLVSAIYLLITNLQAYKLQIDYI